MCTNVQTSARSNIESWSSNGHCWQICTILHSPQKRAQSGNIHSIIIIWCYWFGVITSSQDNTFRFWKSKVLDGWMTFWGHFDLSSDNESTILKTGNWKVASLCRLLHCQNCKCNTQQVCAKQNHWIVITNFQYKLRYIFTSKLTKLL